MRTVIALSLAVGTAPAADWPQFLGPNRDSVSGEVVPAWAEKPKQLWKATVGDAHSSPVVAGGLVYAFYQPKGKNADALAAFDASTGEKKWEKSYDRPAFSPPFGAGPRGTPTVAGDRVFTFGGTGVLAAWDAKSGDLKWKVDTFEDTAAKNLFFGASTSPTVVGDTVLVMTGGKKGGVAAYNIGDGTRAWAATKDPASYATPLPLVLAGRPSLVFLTGANVVAVDPAGKVLWQHPFRDLLNESSTTPVKAGGLVIASSVTAGSIALKLTDSGVEAKPVWADPKLTCYFSTPVLVGDHLYMVNGAATLRNPSVTLRCVSAATGKVLWEKPKFGKYHAALIRTGDDKLLVLDDTGTLRLVQPDAGEYKELAAAKVCGPTWAHPALADGRLYLRDDAGTLQCLQVGK